MYFISKKIFIVAILLFSAIAFNITTMNAQAFIDLHSLYKLFPAESINSQYANVDYHPGKNKLSKAIDDSVTEKKKSWTFTYGLDLNLSNFFEVNSPTPPDKKNLSVAAAIDLGLDYKKDTRVFQMTNEFHWLMEIQKSGLTSSARIQRVTDDLKTLHDFAIAANKRKKWNLNLIAKTSTSVFTIYNGDYFEDFNHLGRIKGFINPYEVTLSPGVKYQPNDYLRVSVSPYSMSLYGLESQQIANTGLYTHDSDENNNYDLFIYKQLGAEANLWYDRNIKDRIIFQYRLGISTDYFTNIGKNGLMDGMFITKIKLVKNLYLSHRALLKGDLAMKPFKPHYSQIIMLGFAKSL